MNHRDAAANGVAARSFSEGQFERWLGGAKLPQYESIASTILPFWRT